MINIQDQENLFKLIANYLEKDVECYTIGGTAMMFRGYKAATKDIDLVFKSESDRKTFITAIEKLGYTQRSIKLIYSQNRLEQKNTPLMYSRGEERFDLFVKDVFGFDLDFTDFVQRHDYLAKKELIVFTASKELLIILKAVTNREKDYEDIESIVKIEPNLNWHFIVDKAIQKRDKMSWILIDLEEKMQKLKEVTFIKKEVFDTIYKAEEKAAKKTKADTQRQKA